MLQAEDRPECYIEVKISHVSGSGKRLFPGCGHATGTKASAGADECCGGGQTRPYCCLRFCTQPLNGFLQPAILISQIRAIVG